MLAPRYTSDIDAARLTLVRSLENIQKALPENRRRSTQSVSAALAFELAGDNNNNSNTLATTPISRRGQVVGKDDDAWKKHLRPSEIMALEGQLEVLQQDMRDLNNIQARHIQSSRQQWQYAQEEEQAPQLHRLRRVGEVAVLPQVSCRQPNSSSIPSSSSDARVSAADKDSRLLYPTSSSSNVRTHKQQQKHQSAMERQPLMQKPMGSRDIRPIITKVNSRSGNNLSKAATASRCQATAPEVISPTSSANVSSSPVEEVQHYMNQYNGRTVNRRLMAGESLVGSESSHKNHRSSMSSGVKRHSIVERKVRFVEDVQGSQQTNELDRETDNSQVQKPLPTSSSSSSLSSSSSISRTVTSSWKKDNPGLFDTHSLSTDGGDGEVSSRGSTSSQTDGAVTESRSTVEPQINASAVRGGRARTTQRKKSLLMRVFSRKGRNNGSTSSRSSTSSGRKSTSSKWSSTSSRSSVYEQNAPPVSGPIAAGNEPKSISLSSLPNPAGSNYNSAPLPRANSATNTPIRNLLRKHSVSLLNKFTGKDGKAIGTSLGAVAEGTQTQIWSTCVVCLEEFAKNSMIQVPAECLHSYCKNCLKVLFTRALDDHGSFPVKCCGITTIDASVAGSILSANKIARYNELMLEYETADKTYCHNKRCSAFVPPENIQMDEAKCRKCRRITCTHCKKGKHRGVCIEDRDSMEVLQAGKNIGWVQCYRCQHLVEKSDGCQHITCHCKAEFCYKCGQEWKACVRAGSCNLPV